MTKIILNIFAAISGFGLLLLCIAIFCGYWLSIPLDEIESLRLSENYREGKFQNIDPRQKKRSRKAFWKFLTGKGKAQWPEWIELDPQDFPEDQEGDFVQFINHSTVFIRVGGVNVLTDPIFSDRCSPVPFAGPKRVHQPGVKFADLPKIDVVLISHNHYDHLDLKTLKALQERDKPLIVSGIGQAAFFKKQGFNQVKLLDWWDTFEVFNKRITFVPTQHFSSRGTFDRNQALWGSFVIESEQKKIYFAGDTGYGSFVDSLAQKFPNGFDLALIPIGAYLPESIMKPVHINPQEAFQMHQVLKSRLSIGIHWGTFQLTQEARLDPVNALKTLQTQHQDNSFKVLYPGKWQAF